MATNYVILRSVPAPKPQFRTRGPGAAPVAEAAHSPVAVEVDNLSSRRAAEVARSEGVACVAPVVPLKLIAPVPFNAPADAKAGGSTWGVKAVAADQSPFSGEGAAVAILDTGIDSTHPAFAGIELVRKNFTSEADDDLHGHGTHCAGTIAGRDVGGTRIGIARGVKKLLIAKVLGEGGGGSDVLLAAIQWALLNDANVISMSLGIDFPGMVASLVTQGFPADLATTLALEGYRANVMLFERLAALVRSQSAFGKACVLVAAAGNESRREINAEYVIAVSPPAVAEGIVSVAAVGPDPAGFTIAPFSNVGARVSGPGVGVLSAKPGGSLVSMSGTSMATPHVAGVAALWVHKLRSANQLTGQLLTDRLAGSGTLMGFAAGFNPADVGAGMVQAPQQ